MIYFLQEATGEEKLVKIAYSENDREVRTGSRPDNGRRLLVVARLTQGGPAAERGLHLVFGSRKLTGKWFEYTPELGEFIAWAARHRGANPDDAIERARRLVNHELTTRR